jgi:hypothetical protein
MVRLPLLSCVGSLISVLMDSFVVNRQWHLAESIAWMYTIKAYLAA